MPNLVRDKCVISWLFVRDLCVIFGSAFIPPLFAFHFQSSALNCSFAAINIKKSQKNLHMCDFFTIFAAVLTASKQKIQIYGI